MAGPRWTGSALVGRISGVAQKTARVILVTDASSRIPAVIQPSGQRAIRGRRQHCRAAHRLSGKQADLVRPGDRVVTAGDGGVFPAGLLLGQVAADPGGRLRVRLAADYERLEFLRVLAPSRNRTRVRHRRWFGHWTPQPSCPKTTTPELAEE